MADEKDNVVFIGDKKPNVYYSAIVAILEKGNEFAILKTRGKYIRNSIDIVEYTKRTSAGGIVLESIEPNTVKFKDNEGKERYVSEIIIKLKKK